MNAGKIHFDPESWAIQIRGIPLTSKTISHISTEIVDIEAATGMILDNPLIWRDWREVRHSHILCKVIWQRAYNLRLYRFCNCLYKS